MRYSKSCFIRGFDTDMLSSQYMIDLMAVKVLVAKKKAEFLALPESEKERFNLGFSNKAYALYLKEFNRSTTLSSTSVIPGKDKPEEGVSPEHLYAWQARV